MDRPSEQLNKRIFPLDLLGCRKLLLKRIKIEGNKNDRGFEDKNNKQVNKTYKLNIKKRSENSPENKNIRPNEKLIQLKKFTIIKYLDADTIFLTDETLWLEVIWKDQRVRVNILGTTKIDILSIPVDS